MMQFRLSVLFSLLSVFSFSQLPVARDTLTVLENGYVLKMPWANGLNFSNVSNLDLNNDGKKDLVLFDRLNIYGVGRFRCFVNVGTPGQIKYRESWYLSYLFPMVANWAVFKDYDCDGREDLFCSVSSGIKVYRNTSTNSVFGFQLVKSILNSEYNPAGPPKPGNLYASSVGVPGIVDIDNDGDLDVLTFSPQGIFVQYHKNLSREKGYNCDSLIFEYTDKCWGRISENNCEVNMNVCETVGSKENADAPKTYHAGSCLTCLDSDGDLDIDMIMGDVSCDIVQYVHNTGTGGNALFTDTTKHYPNFPGKANTTQIKMNSFPCTYYVDADGDNKRDLIATPNAYNTENYKSVWLYRNTSATSTVNFQFVKNNFLQDEMIEVGQNAFPVLFDYDADGRKDLLIGNYGYYMGNLLKAQLTLYRNVGSSSQPSYSLITRDYGNLSVRTLTPNNLPINHAMPTVGDIDLDGDMDILFGTSSGQIHWLENTAGANNVCNFSVFHQNPFKITTPSSAAAPQLFDLDNDARLDLIIGMQNGRLAWYRNISSTTMPTFTLMNNFLGGVDVKGDPNLFGYDGYAVPFFYRENGQTNALIGSFPGGVALYSVPSTLTNTFTLITKAVNSYNEGSQSAPWYEDVNNDGKRDLFIGNAGGGLNFFSSRSPFVGIDELGNDQVEDLVTCYPNPVKEEWNVRLELPGIQKASLVVRDLLGKEVLYSELPSDATAVNVQGLTKGIYFATITVRVNQQDKYITRKLIKE